MSALYIIDNLLNSPMSELANAMPASGTLIGLRLNKTVGRTDKRKIFLNKIKMTLIEKSPSKSRLSPSTLSEILSVRLERSRRKATLVKWLPISWKSSFAAC